MRDANAYAYADGFANSNCHSDSDPYGDAVTNAYANLHTRRIPRADCLF